MKVKVTIYSNAGGESLCYSEKGELQMTKNGFFADYSLTGDKCRLNYDGKTVTQRREGELSLFTCFCEGEQTECTLEECGRKFSFSVYTKVLSAVLTEEGCTVTLAYIQQGEDRVTEVIFKAERERVPDGKRLPRAYFGK